MKTIEKSPAVMAYVCEYCNAEYKTEEEALACEKFHVKYARVESSAYISAESVYPETVNVEMKDGTIQKYQTPGLIGDDVLTNNTSTLGVATVAIVSAYNVTVSKEYNENIVDETTGEETEETELKVAPVANAEVTLKDGKLYVTIPDEEEVTSEMNICVKVVDEEGNEVTTTTENSPFDEILITAEIKQQIENKCIEETE